MWFFRIALLPILLIASHLAEAQGIPPPPQSPPPKFGPPTTRNEMVGEPFGDSVQYTRMLQRANKRDATAIIRSYNKDRSIITTEFNFPMIVGNREWQKREVAVVGTRLSVYFGNCDKRYTPFIFQYALLLADGSSGSNMEPNENVMDVIDTVTLDRLRELECSFEN